MTDTWASGMLLWMLLGLFCLRVAGQLIVLLFRPRWLPPMPHWYSGVLPYPILLPIQVLFLAVMGAIALDFTRGEGFFVQPRPGVGQAVVYFSYLYAGSMVLRYAVRMKRRPDQRWLGGVIPIVFHIVLATFLYVFGTFHAL